MNKLRLAAASALLVGAAGCSKGEGAAAGTNADAAPHVDAAPHADAAKPAAGPLAEGSPAPDLGLTLQDGSTLKLASLKGKPVVVYFYPKDDTPGCTVEAQSIRDAWPDFKSAGVEVLGVSTQDAESHKAFIAKHNLPFRLVVDGDGSVARAFGVPVNGEYAARQTFLIGKDGVIKHVWRNVDPKSHATEVLTAAKSA